MTKKKKPRRSVGAPSRDLVQASATDGTLLMEYKVEAFLSASQLQKRRLLINEALESNPVDVALLRQLALSPGGLLNTGFRQRAWPKLLGINRYEAADYHRFVTDHPDAQQLWKDVDRSFYHFKQFGKMKERERKLKRQQLFDIMNAVISQNPALKYYQGFHDICTVFLLMHDDKVAFEMAERVSQFPIRECMRPNFVQVIEILRMLFPLLEERDKEVHQFIQASGIEPYFALPWVLTWFSHHINDLDVVGRLFDVFLSTHPLFSLYVSAAIVLQRKDKLLLCECEFSAVHNFLSKLPPELDVEAAIQDALQIFEEVPPHKLVLLSHAKVLRSSTFLNYPFRWQTESPASDVMLYKQWKDHKKGSRERRDSGSATQDTEYAANEQPERFRLTSWPADDAVYVGDGASKGKYLTVVAAVGTAVIVANFAQLYLQRGGGGAFFPSR